jgi:hypothetical protein
MFKVGEDRSTANEHDNQQDELPICGLYENNGTIK